MTVSTRFFNSRISNLILIILIQIVSLTPFDARCQWSNKNDGLTGGRMRAFLVNGSRIFAGTEGVGIFRSDNNGEAWVASNNGLWADGCYKFLVQSGRIYAATNGGIFFSDNNGDSWNYIEGVNATRAIVLKGDYLFASTNTFGMKRYSLTAKTWQSANTGLETVFVMGLCVYNTDILAATSSGLYRSNNNGDSWEKITTALTTGYIEDIVRNDSYLFVLANSTVYRSVDGIAWSKLGTGSPFVSGFSISVTGSTVYVGTGIGNAGIFRSPDNGASWQLISNGLTNSVVETFADAGNGTVFLGADEGGVFRSTDNGINWTPVNKGFHGIRPYEISGSGSIRFAATRNGFFVSEDGGEHWTSRSTGLKGRSLSVHNVITSENRICIATSGGIYVSDDNAQTWSPSNTGLPLTTVSNLVKTSSGSFYVGISSKGVFRSIDKGQSWTAVNNGLTSSDNISTLNANGDDLYLGTYESGVFRLTEGKSQWTTLNTGATIMDAIDFAFHGSYVYVASEDNGIYRSLDKGANWAPFKTGEDFTIGLAADETGVYVLTLNWIFRLAEDTDTSWIELYQNSKWMNSIDIFDGSLYVGGTGELITAQLEQVIVGTEPFRKTTFSVFPNPVSSILYFTDVEQSVPYSINLPTGITIRQGTTLHNIDASSVSVDDLPEGIYLLRINGKHEAKTSKFVVKKK